MFKGIIVSLLTLTIILFPIPLKITLKYSNKVLEIYIYNKKIKVKTPSKVNVKTKVKPKQNVKENFFKSFTFNDIKSIIYKIKYLKFKPILIVSTKLEYGFNDAAMVAILFGLIHSTYSFLYLLLINFAKVKSINLKVIPHFKENDFNMGISCIIYTNLGKIIYMSFVMINCIIGIKHKNTKLKKYKGGNVHG